MKKEIAQKAIFETSFDIKSIDKEARIIKGIASLEEVDRDGEIIAMEAFESSLKSYLENPIIRYRHKDPIGVAIPEGTYIDKVGRAFVVEAKISDKTQFANEAWGLIIDGIVKSFSVGGRVQAKEAIKMGDKQVNKITKMELYEVSVVDIPSNRKSFFEVIKKAADEVEDESLYEGKLGVSKDSTSIKITEKRGTKMSEKQEQPEESSEEEQPKEEPKESGIAKEEVEKMVQERVDAKMKEFAESQPDRKAIQEETTTKTEVTYKTMTNSDTMEDVYGRDATYAKGIFGNGEDDLRESVSFKDAFINLTKLTDTTTGGAGTAGYALIPVYVDPVIVDRTRRELPFIELVPRRAVKGLTYEYNAITALSNAIAVNEDAALADLTDTYDRFSTTLRTYVSTGRVTEQAIVGSRGFADAVSREVANRTLGLKRKEDYDALTAQSAPSFSGIQGLVTTNVTALGGALTVSAIRTEIDQCRDSGGIPNVIVTTNTLLTSLKGLLMDYQRFVDSTKIAWGIETISFDGIPVVVDRYCASGYFWILDMSVIFMAVSQDMVFGELARTNLSYKFELHMIEALIVQAETFCSGLSGCT